MLVANASFTIFLPSGTGSQNWSQKMEQWSNWHPTICWQFDPSPNSLAEIFLTQWDKVLRTQPTKPCVKSKPQSVLLFEVRRLLNYECSLLLLGGSLNAQTWSSYVHLHSDGILWSLPSSTSNLVLVSKKKKKKEWKCFSWVFYFIVSSPTKLY